MPSRQPSASVQQLSTTSLDLLEQQIATGALADDLRTVFGEAGAAELEQMAQTGAAMTLGDEERPLVVVLPGVLGSTLMNTSGDVGLIWANPLALVAGKLALLRLDTRGTRDLPGTVVVPVGLLPTHYLLLQMHLKTFGGCDVYSFPYDWRRTPAAAVERLRTLVADLTHNSSRKVHLVGHSMGGLVARNYCASYPDQAERAVAQIIQLGAPNYGSYSAVQTLLTSDGMVGVLQKLNAQNDPLAFTRSCPGIYAMFPAPRDAYPASAPEPYPFSSTSDVYDQAAFGIDALSSAHLSAARAAYQASAAQSASVPTAIIAGFDLPTCVGMQINRDGASPIFSFGEMGDGDGTVPLASVTALPGARLYYGRGLKHGDLPLYGGVRAAVVELVHGREPTTVTSNRFAQVLGDEPALTLSVPEAPTPAELDYATVDAIAGRVRMGVATPSDLRALALL